MYKDVSNIALHRLQEVFESVIMPDSEHAHYNLVFFMSDLIC